MTTDAMDYKEIEVTPQSAALGAVISGVDLSKEPSKHAMAELEDAFGPLPTEDVPLFVSTDCAPERKRFLWLPDVANSFKESSGPPGRVTLASLKNGVLQSRPGMGVCGRGR